MAHSELARLAGHFFEEMVKAVVDVKKEIIAVDAELHSDLESLLLKEGSKQGDLWGINLYPGQEGDGFIEFDSMINLRPSQGNRSRGVEDPRFQRAIVDIVAKKIGR